jgi:hypothetical protein
VIVQYSLHKLYPDGSIKHYGAVMGWQGEQRSWSNRNTT